MLKRLVLMFCVLIGCAVCISNHPRHKDDTENVSADAEVVWQKTGDYYALLKIVDAHIDPRYNGNVSEADVIKYLGDGSHDGDGYPGAGPNVWVYSSSRCIPEGSYLFV